MQKEKALKYSVLFSLIFVASLAGAAYALSYTVKKEVLYTQSFKIDGKEQVSKSFYLSAPAALFEVKLSVSEGTIKWSPHSAVLFEASLGSFQGWECETDNGTVKWRIDPENLNQVWHLSFFNEDLHEKEVVVEVTKVWSEQNIQGWI